MTRYATASSNEARQLRWLVPAVALSVLVLVAGLLAGGSPRRVLTVPLIPVAAGVVIVEASHESLVREVRSPAKRIVTAQDEARRRGSTDLYFTPEDSQYEVKHMHDAEYRPIPSIWGHQAGRGLARADADFVDAGLRDLLSS